MNHQLTPTQAFWLGHLHHAFSVGQSLSDYANEQGLCFADLMAWRQRLIVQKIDVPDMYRPNRFVSVAGTPDLVFGQAFFKCILMGTIYVRHSRWHGRDEHHYP